MKDSSRRRSTFLERKGGGASATSCSRACRRGEVMRHSLPWPASPGVPSMPRAVVEVVVDSGLGPVRVMTTHLEYYSAEHRGAQIGRLEGNPPGSMRGSPARRRARQLRIVREAKSAVSAVTSISSPTTRSTARSWTRASPTPGRRCNPGKPHPHTFKLYDKDEEPYCCDYVFVTPDLVPRLRSIRIDSANAGIRSPAGDPGDLN